MTELIKCKLGFKPKEWGEKGNEAYFYLFIYFSINEVIHGFELYLYTSR